MNKTVSSDKKQSTINGSVLTLQVQILNLFCFCYELRSKGMLATLGVPYITSGILGIRNSKGQYSNVLLNLRI